MSIFNFVYLTLFFFHKEGPSNCINFNPPENLDLPLFAMWKDI